MHRNQTGSRFGCNEPYWDVLFVQSRTNAMLHSLEGGGKTIKIPSKITINIYKGEEATFFSFFSPFFIFSPHERTLKEYLFFSFLPELIK